MHTVHMMRDSVLTLLTRSGTRKGVDALARAVQEFPQYPWLKFYLLDARNITRALLWLAPAPEHILSLFNNRDSRFIQSGAELLDLIIESLERLEMKLLGESAASQFLWGPTDAKTFKPRDENALSDFIKLHFEYDLVGRGIVVNREVRIHRGERTDLHVDILSQGTREGDFDITTVILEAKGSWNPELNEAMESQLVGKYLKDNHCQHGLYLVGWYSSDLWDESDYRRKQVPTVSIDEARAQFNAQARSLSSAGLTVRAFVLNVELRNPSSRVSRH
jgi:hypothetical protein